MADSSLPVEILEVIFEDLISEYTTVAEEGGLLPRWYLLPLLRVCKLWHLVGERHLYRSISIGSKFPIRRIQMIAGHLKPEAKREGHMIASALLEALKGNSRLATLVEELQMGVRLIHINESRSGKSTLLLDICPNLRYVDLREVPSSHLYSLLEVLKKKNLVSFRINVLRSDELTSFPIFDLIQSWPQIQKLRVDGLSNMKLTGREQEFDSQASDARNCCPELREIVLKCESPRENDLASLRLMCSVVTKLEVGVDYPGTDTKALDALCGCLHAWSQTLECLSIHIGPLLLTFSSYRPLSETLSSLTNLQELRVSNCLVDFGAISDLPQLKRLDQSFPYSSAELVMDHLANLLEDPEKFVSLLDIEVLNRRHGTLRQRLRDVCHRRNIALRM